MGREAARVKDFSEMRFRKAARKIEGLAHLERVLPADDQQRVFIREGLRPFLSFLICSSKTCLSRRPSKWRPILELFREQGFPLAIQKVGEVRVNVQLCLECKKKATLTHLLIEKAKEGIEKDMAAAGKPLPHWSLTKVSFEDMSGGATSDDPV